MPGKTKNAILFAAFAALGCSSAPVARGSVERVTTLSQARQDYYQGLKALEEGEYLVATEHLQKVARGPSYIVYSPLARLRLADALFMQEKYDEAVEAYRSFTETNEGDPNLHYAWFRMAESKVKALPFEWFLVPPSDRRDPTRVRSAMLTLDEFVRRFPDSPYVEDGIAILERMARTVISFEMEVAHFYMTRNKPAGAVGRLQRLLAEVPRAGGFEDARFAYVEALAANGDKEVLGRECESFRQRFPSGRHRDRVESLCRAATASAGNESAEVRKL